MIRCCAIVFLFPVVLLLMSLQRASCGSTVVAVSTVASAAVLANGAVLSNFKNASVSEVLIPSPVSLSATTTRRPLFQGARAPCDCDAGQCGCCTGVILERFRQKACMNFTYEPDDFSITATISMNDRVLYKNTFSGKNPPPMCIRIPRFRFIELCVEVSNVYLSSRNIHMCVDAAATWDDFTLVEWSFDCFRMGASGVAIVRPEDGGGLPANPIDEEEQTDEDYDDSARDVNGTKYKVRSPGAIQLLESKDNVPVIAREIDGHVQFILKDIRG